MKAKAGILHCSLQIYAIISGSVGRFYGTHLNKQVGIFYFSHPSIPTLSTRYFLTVFDQKYMDT